MACDFWPIQAHGKGSGFVIHSLNSSEFCPDFFSLCKMSVVLCQPTLSYLDIYLKYEYLRTSSVFAYVFILFLEKWASQF